MIEIITNRLTFQLILNALNFLFNRSVRRPIELEVEGNNKKVKVKGRPQDLLVIMPEIKKFIG